MAADEAGNDVGSVFVPVTGFVGFAPAGTKIPTRTQGKAAQPVLEAAFKKLGLLTDDGGPEWTEEADGDAIPFWQDGYQMPSGLAKVELKITLAQTDAVSQEFIRGVAYDSDKSLVVDASGNPKSYVIWVEEIAKNGTIRRRCCANARVTAIQSAKSKRGEVMGHEVTISLSRSPKEHPDGQFIEWLLTAEDLTGAGIP